MYHPIFSPNFQKELARNGNIKERVRKCVEGILAAPYDRTELLVENLKGLRSARIGRNFRIIFAVSEEIVGSAEARKNFPKFWMQFLLGYVSNVPKRILNPPPTEVRINQNPPRALVPRIT